MTHQRLRLGADGESLVAGWYEAHGYEVLARNWRSRIGELDLVVRRNRLYVFCEVKTRATNAFGSPAFAVGHEKRRRLRHLAAQWLQHNEVRATGIRFDVATVVGAEVEVIEAAF